MESNEAQPWSNRHPERVVVVDSSKYAELLVSRRKLERVVNREDQLHDVETHETFVQQSLRKDGDLRTGLAKGA
jgi:hypothetical protein